MRNHPYITVILFLVAVLMSACSLDEQEEIRITGEEELTLRDSKSITIELLQVGDVEVPAIVELEVSGPFVQVTGFSKQMTPGTTYYSFFYDQPNCSGGNLEPILVAKWNVDLAGRGTLMETVKVPIERIGSVSVTEGVRGNDFPGVLRSCGEVNF